MVKIWSIFVAFLENMNFNNLDNLLHMDRPKVSWQIKVKTYCVEISNWTCWKDSCVKSLFISTVWRDFSHELMIICNQISDYCLNYCHFFHFVNDTNTMASRRRFWHFVYSKKIIEERTIERKIAKKREKEILWRCIN